MVAGSALASTQVYHDLYLAVVTDPWLVSGRQQAGDQVGRDIHTVKPGLGHMLTSVERVLPCSGVGERLQN